MKIVIDAMGGDRGAFVAVNASLQALSKHSDISRLYLVGDEQLLNAELSRGPNADDLSTRIEVLHSSGVVDMSATPSQILKQQSDTSMLVALKALAEGMADACISSGNTGALLGLARKFSGMQQNLSRPAICVQLPTSSRATYLLDVGANVDCSAQQLHQFAGMGCALVEAMHGVARCQVKALSIGTEAGKGNAAVKQAEELCRDDQSMNYAGLIEGDRLLMGDSDVVFCDGFVGNIALKSCEGTAHYIRALAQEKLLKASQLADAEQKSPLSAFFEAMDPSRYNGACLLGLNHLVFKSHGDSNTLGFLSSIEKAVEAVHGQAIAKLSERL